MCSNSSAIREREIKTARRYHYTLSQMAKKTHKKQNKKTVTVPKAGWNVEKTHCSYSASGPSPSENIRQFLTKWHMQLPHDQAIALLGTGHSPWALGMHPDHMKTYAHTNLYVNVCSSSILYNQILQVTPMSFKGWLAHKLWHIYST